MKPIAFPRLTANLVLSLLDLVQYPIFFQTQRLLANGSETLTALMDVALDLSWRVRYSGGEKIVSQGNTAANLSVLAGS